MKIGSLLVMGAMFWGSSAIAQEAAKPSTATSTNPKTEPPPILNANATYKIGPQDVLRIDVWKEEDISRTVPVRPDGKISLPLLNDVQAAGLTSMELAATIREGLTKYITNPQVTVTVSEINSRRVYCNGEFQKAGFLQLLPNMTALQAISSCGGFTQFAKVKGIYILRVADGKQARIPLKYKDVLKGSSLDIPLQPGDIIVVP